jgi:Uma2 family endonuclease
VLATGLTTYPDVTIVCGAPELDPDDENTVTNPTLIVEVLSPSFKSCRSST